MILGSHLHETIQPVVHKETIEPHVVHTTVPVHETHHNKAQHHQTTTLPAVNMSEWQKQGGLLHGRDERYDNFEGQPEDVGGVAEALRRSHDSNKDPVTGHTFHGDFNEEGGREGHHAKHSSRGNTMSSTTDNRTGGTSSMMGTTGATSSSMMGATGGNTASSTGRGAMVDEPLSSASSTHGSSTTGTASGAAASAAAMAMRSGRDTTNTGTTGGMTGRNTGAVGGMTGTSGMTGTPGMTGSSGMTGKSRHARSDSGYEAETYDKRKPGAFDTNRVGEQGRTEKMMARDEMGEAKKPGLLDRLNPMTDTTGDGETGFMK